VSPSNPSYNFNMTIWYPYTNQSMPEANCIFQPQFNYPRPLYAWCTAVAPNSFVISQPSPPPE
jgi:hypothetical protein